MISSVRDSPMEQIYTSLHKRRNGNLLYDEYSLNETRMKTTSFDSTTTKKSTGVLSSIWSTYIRFV